MGPGRGADMLWEGWVIFIIQFFFFFWLEPRFFWFYFYLFFRLWDWDGLPFFFLVPLNACRCACIYVM
jgi:hypothetical protein